MRTTRWLELEKLLPADLVGTLGKKELLVPNLAFRPDPWSFAFQRGLRKLPLQSGQIVWEVGCGTGLNLILLSAWFPEIWLRYSDYQKVCVPVSTDNLYSATKHARIMALAGQWDLLTPSRGARVIQIGIVDRDPVDYVVACIPQIPRTDIDLNARDNRAHYYNPKYYPDSDLHTVGLGLVDSLLAQAPRVLKPNGRVVLNLGGRPGQGRLLKMFNRRGYDARIIHEEIKANRDAVVSTFRARSKIARSLSRLCCSVPFFVPVARI